MSGKVEVVTLLPSGSTPPNYDINTPGFATPGLANGSSVLRRHRGRRFSAPVPNLIEGDGWLLIDVGWLGERG